MPNRYEAITSFYGHKADELRRAVTRAVSGPEAMIEDACSYAWCQLLVHDEVVLDRHGFGWLYCVAIREGYRLSGRARREAACGRPDQLPRQRGLAGADAWELLERRLDHDARLSLLAEIPRRRRRLVILQLAGFTYEEIARITGDTRRTVERQLLRGKRALRRLQHSCH
jgi:DNA-directed RNA polymerase specialized sigma24 family protein